jgi:hypothetical protein
MGLAFHQSVFRLKQTPATIEPMSEQSTWQSKVRRGVPSRIALFLLIALMVAGLGAAAVALLGQGSARITRTPLVEFEIQLPAGILLPGDRHIDVMLWNGRSGHGCKIIQVRRDGPRPVIYGQVLARRGDGEQRLSLRLNDYSEGFWPLPGGPDARPDPSFGPWQPISFVEGPRTDEAPLPPGRYDVRYRIAKYM